MDLPCLFNGRYLQTFKAPRNSHSRKPFVTLEESLWPSRIGWCQNTEAVNNLTETREFSSSVGPWSCSFNWIRTLANISVHHFNYDLSPFHRPWRGNLVFLTELEDVWADVWANVFPKTESCDIDRHCPAGYPMTNGISALGFKVGSPPTTEGYNIYIYI